MKSLLKATVIVMGIIMSTSATVFGQVDSIIARMILIGDAGEMDMQQGGVITSAVNNVLKDRTTIFYLGDNIYPRGMGLPGSKEEQQTKEIIISQFRPFRALNAPVYFIPGNHDWDKSGPLGLEKIKKQGSFLKEQKDTGLALVPQDGCPGPYEISITDDLVVLAFDSEWWLFPFNKITAKGTCECNSEDEVISKFKLLFEKNKGKTIVLASHHPFQTYGSHGGYFSWKDHIFPLTAINHKLYIPLPLSGSLYPLIRSIFKNPEDQGHKSYQNMIVRIDSVFTGYKQLIHIAGHDHGLQFIKNNQIQVVSGSGAKHSYVRNGKDSRYASTKPGYVIMDRLINNYVRFTYYAQTDGKFGKVFYTECKL
jgi:calcineurin-like phosphoesterase family protein